MTIPEDNPFAPPSYPPPTNTPWNYPPPSGPSLSPATSGGEAPPPYEMDAVPKAAPWKAEGVPTESKGNPQAPVNRSARWAFLLALLTPVLTPIAGITAIALGKRSRKETAQTGEEGAGLATAGIWMGGAFSILWVFAVAFLIAVKVGSIAG